MSLGDEAEVMGDGDETRWQTEHFYRPPPGLPYAIIILNQALTQNNVGHVKYLWQNACVRVCVDGGTNGYHDLMSGPRSKSAHTKTSHSSANLPQPTSKTESSQTTSITTALRSAANVPQTVSNTTTSQSAANTAATNSASNIPVPLITSNSILSQAGDTTTTSTTASNGTIPQSASHNGSPQSAANSASPPSSSSSLQSTTNNTGSQSTSSCASLSSASSNSTSAQPVSISSQSSSSSSSVTSAEDEVQEQVEDTINNSAMSDITKPDQGEKGREHLDQEQHQQREQELEETVIAEPKLEENVEDAADKDTEEENGEDQVEAVDTVDNSEKDNKKKKESKFRFLKKSPQTEKEDTQPQEAHKHKLKLKKIKKPKKGDVDKTYPDSTTGPDNNLPAITESTLPQPYPELEPQPSSSVSTETGPSDENGTCSGRKSSLSDDCKSSLSIASDIDEIEEQSLDIKSQVSSSVVEVNGDSHSPTSSYSSASSLSDFDLQSSVITQSDTDLSILPNSDTNSQTLTEETKCTDNSKASPDSTSHSSDLTQTIPLSSTLPGSESPSETLHTEDSLSEVNLHYSNVSDRNSESLMITEENSHSQTLQEEISQSQTLSTSKSDSSSLSDEDCHTHTLSNSKDNHSLSVSSQSSGSSNPPPENSDSDSSTHSLTLAHPVSASPKNSLNSQNLPSSNCHVSTAPFFQDSKPPSLSRPRSLSHLPPSSNSSTCTNSNMSPFSRDSKYPSLSRPKSLSHLPPASTLPSPFPTLFHRHLGSPFPDLITGDFDSVRPELLKLYADLGVTIVPTPEQDETDFTKAIRVLGGYVEERKMRIEHVVVIAGVGNDRYDHVMATVATLYKVKSLVSVPVVLVSGESLVWILEPGSHKLEVSRALVEGPPDVSWCGLVPLGHPVTATTRGLKWNLDNETMAFGGLVSTSNTYDPSNHGDVEITTSHPLLWTMGWGGPRR